LLVALAQAATAVGGLREMLTRTGEAVRSRAPRGREGTRARS